MAGPLARGGYARARLHFDGAPVARVAARASHKRSGTTWLALLPGAVAACDIELAPSTACTGADGQLHESGTSPLISVVATRLMSGVLKPVPFTTFFINERSAVTCCSSRCASEQSSRTKEVIGVSLGSIGRMRMLLPEITGPV